MSEVKYRHEDKYVCDAVQNTILKLRASGIMRPDIHVGEKGSYQIRSLYFDDWDDRCYYENESGIGDRAKYRIRIYNNDSSRITLEKKSKNRGMTLKISCRLTEDMCRKLMNGQHIVITEDMSGQQKQLLSELEYKQMRPVVIVEYLRYPFVEANGNVRITFDEAITSSNKVTRFLEEDIGRRPIMERGRSILEVKWDEYLPDYIKNHMQLDSIQKTSFSKYYLCRKYNTDGGIKV